MSAGDPFAPPSLDEQARLIVADLRNLGVDDLDEADVRPVIDPEKPVSVNLRAVRETLVQS